MEEVRVVDEVPVDEGADLRVLVAGGREGAGGDGGGGVDLYDAGEEYDGVGDGGDGADCESVDLVRFSLLRPLVPLPPLLPKDPKPSVRLKDADSVSLLDAPELVDRPAVGPLGEGAGDGGDADGVDVEDVP